MNGYIRKHSGFVTLVILTTLSIVPLILLLGLTAVIAVFVGIVLSALLVKMTYGLRELSDRKIDLSESE